jgi:hypothetical protein
VHPNALDTDRRRRAATEATAAAARAPSAGRGPKSIKPPVRRVQAKTQRRSRCEWGCVRVWTDPRRVLPRERAPLPWWLPHAVGTPPPCHAACTRCIRNGRLPGRAKLQALRCKICASGAHGVRRPTVGRAACPLASVSRTRRNHKKWLDRSHVPGVALQQSGFRRSHLGCHQKNKARLAQVCGCDLNTYHRRCRHFFKH